AIRRHRAEVEAALEQARARESELDQAVAADAPLVARTQETWYRLSALEERFRGTASLAGERARHLAAEPEQARTGREPEAMEAEAAEVRVQEQTLQVSLNEAKAALTDVVAHRQDLERRLTEAERGLVAAARAVADRREGLAKLIGQVNALRTRASAAADEITRLSAAATEARERGSVADAELNRVQAEVGALDEGELSLDERHEAAVAAYESAAARVRELTTGEREAERERATWTARAEALAIGLTRKDGAGALLAAGSRLPGVRGSLAALLTVEPGFETAVAAALGAQADAIAVDSWDDVVAAFELLRTDDAGRAGLIVGTDHRPDTEHRPPISVGADARWAAQVVTAPERFRASVEHALSGVLIVEDLGTARRLAERYRVVTRDGDVLGAGWAAGGSSSAPSAIEIQAAVDEAQQKADEAAARHDRTHAQLAEATARAEQLQAGVETALNALHQSDARLSAVAEQLAELGQAARSAGAEATRLETARAAAEQARDRDLAGLSDLEERLHLAESGSDVPAEPDTAERDSLQGEVAQSRQGEMEARLAVRTGEERARAVAGRADQLVRAAEVERNARRRQQQAREARARAAVVAGAVRDVAEQVLTRIGASVVAAVAERDAAQQARVVREGELLTLRTRSRTLAQELAQLTDAVHRDEMVRAEQRLRIEQLETRAGEEYGVDAEALIGEYGPELPCPPSALETAEYEQALERGEQVLAPQPGPFHRPTQEKRASRAERDLALLGKVNPLALEEFAALEERHQFLSTQLEDLKATRRDLLIVVKEVDDRILEVFTAAYHDVAREFEIVFQSLFPGGEGRLILTDPDDMLMTGIEVEARPPGKKVKRLSLLSGGERSLVAVALLVAIFRARPSPFYILDEIEAALDDINLGRLLELISQLRSNSQIIIITHQKRTMEIADALYGVTMRGDGVTQVISQRLHDAGERVGAAAIGAVDAGISDK
ncbi:MAG: AAA family ATPase, partial [Jatrophihabitantaceae bacterium]